MASFNEKGRGKGSNRRDPARARHRLPGLESLEDRRLLTGSGTLNGPPLWHPISTNLGDVQNGPMAKAGQQLIDIYQGNSSKYANIIEFSGSSVGIDARGYGDPTAYQNALKNLGMQVVAVVPQANEVLVEGYLPISQLANAAELVNTIGLSALYKPDTKFIGAANNEAESSMKANTARTQFGVDGTGQTIGVISDSVNVYNGGIAASVKTGDIPAASDVTVLQDGPAGSTDEGRAMIENIYDIAPGVKTAFNTAGPGDAAFATAVNNIVNQTTAKVVVDDIGYPDEPFFQDGVAAQAVRSAAQNHGVNYYSAAGNLSNQGYQSPFRGVSGNVTGVGSGTFFNFNPSGGTLTNLPVTTSGPNVTMTLQWDQPFYTTNGVISSLNFYVLDANNNVVASSTTNAIATQQPIQILTIPSAGSYQIVVQVASGPNPNHIWFIHTVGEAGDLTINDPFGTAGGVAFSSAYGHSATQNMTSVGAVPWWAAPPYTANPPQINSEPFSAFGPQTYYFAPDGSPLPSEVTTLGPIVSGADGGNTSFFSPGGIIDTSKPPFPGEPATPTNLSQNLPSFFGTSSAAPNVAAVAALMLQLSPSASEQAIQNALTSTATPLNGSPAGTWNQQGGFGLVNAVSALNAIDNLQVSSIVPGGAAAVNSAPSFITVTFNKPVLFSTVTAAALTVTGPAGVVVTVGTPIAVDNPTTPTIVEFPITITRPAGGLANGVYTETLNANSITAVDGKKLIGFSSTFNLQDTVAPRITGTSITGRVIKISFSAPLDPTTVTKQNFLVVRANNPLYAFNNNPSNIVLTNDPRVVLAYNPTTFTVTIDLTGLDQTLLPTDRYAIAVNSSPDGVNSGPGVTDSVGNHLDGEFINGTFPTGDGLPGGTFFYDLGVLTLGAPIFNSIVLDPASDSGIKGDQNTNVQQPTFDGQIGANFPGTVAGVEVLVEFNGIQHNSTITGQPLPLGTLDLNVGLGGRGYSGNFDAVAITDASGRFSIKAPKNLPDGLNRVRFVVIGQPDVPVVPGLSATTDVSLRIDTSLPRINYNLAAPSGATIPDHAAISSLTNLTLFVYDPINPPGLSSPFATPILQSFPALDPATADNISNYSLYQIDPNNANIILADDSSFIATATFVSTTVRRLTSDPFTGNINLTFNAGLPAGSYVLIARTREPGFSGLADAAGNPLAGGLSTPNSASDYYLPFTFQPLPAYITSVKLLSPDGTTSGPRAYFEEPQPGVIPRADAPPTKFVIDFSNPLNATANYTDAVQLIASADTFGGTPDGNFGTLGVNDNGTGYSRVDPAGTTITLQDSISGALPGQPGFDNELVLTLPTGFTLSPDYYRLYLPNAAGGTSSIVDAFGNQLDGEFLGNQTAGGGYEDLLPNGQYRNGLSGDGLAGGSFMTGYVVVPNGNIIYANPSAAYDPITPSTFPDGSLAKPYPVLAPQAYPNAINGGDLNSAKNSGTIGFDPNYDRAGTGKFAPSALYAAQLASARGPVVVVALPGALITDPVTGLSTQKTFVLQAPSGSNSIINDGSVAVPTMTTLVFAAGSTLKLQNASLLIQNQGSALEVQGGANLGVTFTSYADNTIGTINPNASTPRPGDWGGIVFRNYDQQNRTTNNFPGQIATSTNPTLYGRLQGPGGADAISGADDIMSVINFATIRYGGGAVPVGNGFRYDSVMAIDSRPAITNVSISSGAQAGLSVDVDSLREDNAKRGALVRRVGFASNSINGIFIRAEANGVAEPTNAINYPLNPTNEGGARNFTLDSPYPYVLNTPLVMGTVFLWETGGNESAEPDRLYVEPGMMVKFTSGAGIETRNNGQTGRQASLNVGERTYINEFDNNPNLSPTLANGKVDPNFKANGTAVASDVFTSIYDNLASTSYFDPVTGITTPIVAPIDSANSGGQYQPTPGNVPARARWGGVAIVSPTVGVINNATIEYGGGVVNTATGTTGRHALELAGVTDFFNFGFGFQSSGAHVSITNNSFTDDADVPINMQADALLAGNLQEPLTSGAPFIHGNIFQRNDFNGVGVNGAHAPDRQNSVVNVDSLWPGTDFTYILRSTISMGGGNFSFNAGRPVGNPNQLDVIPPPSVTLTVQSTLGGTVLADGSVIPKLGGVPVVIKLQGTAPNTAWNTTQNITAEDYQGAGFVSGHDNGVDPTTDPLIDIGVNSSMRFLGIPADQTSGQQRVPVIITSIHDSTVGTTVRGVAMNQAISSDTTAPAPGDGGNIVFGSLTATNFNLQDARFGNRIDNVDMRYMGRIEQIGDGIVNLWDVTGTNSYNVKNEPNYDEKFGFPLPLVNPNGGKTFFGDQTNGPNTLTIAGSNIAYFRDYGVWAHPGFGMISVPQNYNGMVARGPFQGEPTYTYLVNDTFSNIGTPTTPGIAVQVTSQTTNNDQFPSPAQMISLNDTFYKDTAGIVTTAPNFNGLNDLSHVQFLAMDDIFSNITGAAINPNGQDFSSQAQYNLYFQVGSQVTLGGDSAINRWLGNNGAFTGNPEFVNPALLNFNLLPNSAAIDSARSDIGPLPIGDMLYPAVDPILGPQGGIRNTVGWSNVFGGLGFIPSNNDYVALPGDPLVNYNVPGFTTDWIPQLPGTPGSFSSNNIVPGANFFSPRTGERDQNGNQRVDDPNVPNLGAGAVAYFDIGAFEYIQTFPPHVVGVTATYTDPTSPTGVSTKNLYSVGGIAGTNVTPTSIDIQFDQPIDPTTINAQTVQLIASGGTGLFAVGAGQAKAINLAGKLSFIQATDTLVINTSGLNLTNDEYRIILVGSGPAVLKDPQGYALDGFNLDANGNQAPLPSGSGVPGSNFQVTFTIDTNSPVVILGSFHIDQPTDTNRRDGVTRDNKPSFQGSITDVFPPLNAVAGQTVIIDISTKGDGVFDLLNAGVGTTDTNGNFDVPVTVALPDSPYGVGANGYLAYDYTKNPPVPQTTNFGYTLARVRVVNAAGNASNTVTDPLSTYVAKGAVTSFVVDTKGPLVTGISPAGNTVAAVVNGVVPVTITFNKNIDPLSINGNSIKVVRSGGDGVFGNGNDVALAIDPASIRFTYLTNPLAPQGPEQVTFNIIAGAGGTLANDVYQVTLKGTGSSTVYDIAGNPLAGTGATGSDFVSTYTVFSQGLSHNLFVGSQVTNPKATLGTRENPFPTIGAAMAVAVTGDVVAVLPGVYTEVVTMKSFVTLRSADLSSTDGYILPGDPLQTIIRAPQSAAPTTTVVAVNLSSIVGGSTPLYSEISGFSIASPLFGNPALGPIQSNSVGLAVVNSTLIVDHDYFVDSAVGLADTLGATAHPPIIMNDVFAGNTVGLAIDGSASTSIVGLGQVNNNDFVLNDNGLIVTASAGTPLLAEVANNIFWQNHDLTPDRAGVAMGANVPDKVAILSNLFSGNGPSQTSSADDTFNISTTFNPGALLPNYPDANGNFAGAPAFVSPRDPRPTSDGPAVFFLDGNFDLTSTSSAIDRSNPTYAPATDFLYRGRVFIPGHAFPGKGPADVGAFEFGGTGGITEGGSTTTGGGIIPGGGVVPTGVTGGGTTGGGSSGGSGGGPTRGGVAVSASEAPTSIDVEFADNVNPSSVTLNDLILSGDGLSVNDPAHAASLSWIDSDTVQFNLAGGYSQGGTVTMAAPRGAVRQIQGRALYTFSNGFSLAPPAQSTGATGQGSPVNGSSNSSTSSKNNGQSSILR